MNEPDSPIDLYGLRLLRLVAEHQSITRAAAAAGLTQSALTRQVGGMEEKLGTLLFERTTRRLRVTDAGKTLLRETALVAPMMEAAVRLIRENHGGAPRELRIGVSRSVSLAHLPGLLHAWMRRPEDGVGLEVSHLGGSELMEAVVQNRLDVAILGAPRMVPPGCAVVHRMPDRFALIAPADIKFPGDPGTKPARWSKPVRAALEEAPWLMLTSAMQTGQDISTWLRKCAVTPRRVSVFDSFDLIIHLAGLGLGIGLVPRRALAGFPRRGRIRTLALPEMFERELVAVTRTGAASTAVHIFVKSILFS